MTCPGQAKFDSYRPKGKLELKFFFSGPVVILKIMQLSKPVKSADITPKTPCIVSRKLAQIRKYAKLNNKGKLCCAADQA